MAAAASGVTVAKAEPGIALLIDPMLAIVILIGLPFGIMFRTARMIGERRPKSEIHRDLAVSTLISGANFVLAAMVAVRLSLSYLEALLLAVIVAATGVKAILKFSTWAWRRLIRDDVAELQGEKRQAEQRELSRLRAIEREWGE
jgi:nitrate reductase beta subunit